MPPAHETRHDVEWSPGQLGRGRALIRRAARAIIGDRGESWLHRRYHRLLRVTGRFGPPEDADTLRTLKAIAARSGTIVDVGANVGRYSWFLRRAAPADARLFALEPHPGAAGLLRGTLAGLRGCTIFELGASDVDGQATLVIPNGAFGSPLSGLAWVEDAGAATEDGRPPIHLRRLDSLVADGSIAIHGPLMLKIDVEGGELRVLRGARELLMAHRPVLYLECQANSLARQGETPETVWEELRAAGYSMFAYRSGRLELAPRASDDIVNYLAIPDLADDGRPDDARLLSVLDAWAGATAAAAAR